MELVLESCTIRSWRFDDAESLVRHANNRKVARHLRDSFPHPYTPDDALDWLDLVTVVEPETNFTIDVDGEAVGGIGLELRSDVYRCSAEMGYWLGEPYWGRGIATEAVVALTGWAFENHDFERIEAVVFGTNPASRRVLDKAGYTFEARLRNAICKDGEIVDEFVYAAWPDRWPPE